MLAIVAVVLGGIILLDISRAARPNALKGDIDGDNTVDITDLSILLSNYGKDAGQTTNPHADINADGAVNIIDLSVLLSNFGTTGASNDLIEEPLGPRPVELTPTGRVVNVTSGQSLASAITAAAAGDSIMIQPGNYPKLSLSGKKPAI